MSSRATRREREVEIPAKQSKCCCGGGAGNYWVYACYFADADIYRISPADGANTLWASGVTGFGRAIACHPDGRVFVASNSGNDVTIYCLAADASVVWSTTKTSVGLAYGLAVTNDSWVYLCTHFTGGISGVYKFEADTGTENTADDWPYVVGAINQRSYRCIAVDQTGNVFVGGDSSDRLIKAFSLDSSGAVRWTSSVTNVVPASEASSLGVYGIAINASGGQVHCVRATSLALNPTVNELYTLNSSTGAVTGQLNVSGSPGATQNGNCAAYDPSGNFYSGITGDASGYKVYKNLAVFAQPNIANTDAMACGPDGDVFACGPKSTMQLVNITKGWEIDFGTRTRTSGMDVSTGRVGAFGI